MTKLFDSIADLFTRIPHALIALLGRLALAFQFWNLGRARMGGSWNLLEPRGSTLALLRNAYDVPYLPAEVAASALQVALHVFPVLLAFGLLSRFAALGLLALTLIFLLFVQPGAYVVYGIWASLLLMLLKYGPGSVSLDHLIGRR